MEETTRSIWDSLKYLYMPLQNTEDWKVKRERFSQLWLLPNCRGANDGKLICINNTIPTYSQVPHDKSGNTFSYYCFGDNPFHLRRYIIRSYPEKNINNKKRICNSTMYIIYYIITISSFFYYLPVHFIFWAMLFL